MKNQMTELQFLIRKLCKQQKKAHKTAQTIVSIFTLIVDVEKTAEEELPVHLSVQEVADYLGIHPSNFYRNVHGKLLLPALTIGRRSYYLESDVRALFSLHETGAHTYSKKRKKNKKRKKS